MRQSEREAADVLHGPEERIGAFGAELERRRGPCDRVLVPAHDRHLSIEEDSRQA
jgi:hypothetical protein